MEQILKHHHLVPQVGVIHVHRPDLHNVTRLSRAEQERLLDFYDLLGGLSPDLVGQMANDLGIDVGPILMELRDELGMMKELEHQQRAFRAKRPPPDIPSIQQRPPKTTKVQGPPRPQTHGSHESHTVRSPDGRVRQTVMTSQYVTRFGPNATMPTGAKGRKYWQPLMYACLQQGEAKGLKALGTDSDFDLHRL